MKELTIGCLLAMSAMGCASRPADPPATQPVTMASTQPSASMKSPFMFKEAPLPQGFPPVSPIGQVVVKQYPAYRSAEVQSAELNNADMNKMFRPLFNHIQRKNIAMTAPVEMEYAPEEGVEKLKPVSMAFLYRNPTQGEAGEDGEVKVANIPPMTVVSIAVRGSYSPEKLGKYVNQLQQWVAEHPSEWQIAGAPRVLGYNSPFVPWFMRVAEVQLPIKPAG